MVLAGNGVLSQGDVRRAIRWYERALEVQPNDGDAHNNLAWLFATHPDAGVRNGIAAIEHAEVADRLDPENPSVLDTLAAAYAEQSRFAEAIATAERGIQGAAAAGQQRLGESMQHHLKTLKSKQPIRDGQ